MAKACYKPVCRRLLAVIGYTAFTSRPNRLPRIFIDLPMKESVSSPKRMPFLLHVLGNSDLVILGMFHKTFHCSFKSHMLPALLSSGDGPCYDLPHLRLPVALNLPPPRLGLESYPCQQASTIVIMIMVCLFDCI